MTSRRHRKTTKRTRSSRRYKRGGSAYSSASSYNSYVNGTENNQYDRVFSQAGPYASIPGNTIIGAQGQNANIVGTPNANNLSLIQSAGSRRRHRKHKRHTKKRHGGMIGAILNQAVVPFSLLGMQQSYKKRGSKK